MVGPPGYIPVRVNIRIEIAHFGLFLGPGLVGLGQQFLTSWSARLKKYLIQSTVRLFLELA